MLAIIGARLRPPSVRRAVALGSTITLLAALGAPALAGAAPGPAQGPASSVSQSVTTLAAPPADRSARRARSVVRVEWPRREVRAGRASQVTGNARPVRATRTVGLQRRGPWGRWQTVRTTRTNARGAFALRVQHPRSGTFAYRVHVSGTAHAAPATTAPVRYTVGRRPVAITARITRDAVAPGTAVDLVGTLTPANGASVVRLQRRSASGEWSTSPHAVPVSATGTWAASLQTTRPGSATYRAITLGTTTHESGTSAPVALRVRRPSSGPPAAQPPNAPASRFVLGAAHGGNSDPAQLEADAGVALQIRRTYFTPDKVARAVQTAEQDIAKGRIPFVSFKLPHTWAEMAAGRGDAWAADAARRLAAVDGEVWVALHHEPEHDQPEILDWTALQKRLAPFFDLPGLRFGICVTGWNQFFSGNPEMSFEHIYPFGAPIDFIALDVYQAYGTPKNETKWTDLDAYWTRMEAFANRVGVDWGLGELGITDAGFASPKGASFFDDTVAGIRAHGGTFAAYFDSELNTSGNSWWLSGAKRAAFLRTLATVAAEAAED